MQCPQCDAPIEDDSSVCAACGASTGPAAPRARRVRAGFALALIALFLIVFAVALLLPSAPAPVPSPPASIAPTASVEPTAPPVNPDRAAVEEAIKGFYATIDAGESVTISPYVFSEGRGGNVPADVGTGTTTFSIARAVVGSGTADVYGRESRSVIATGSAEVEFRLRHVDEKWLISSWRVARETTLAPQALRLSNVTARDIVGTLLQARQVGDATTVRMLTTERFQLRHASWLDGSDQSALLIDYRITGAKKQGKDYEVTVTEGWVAESLRSTFTVIIGNGEILVDAWSFE